MMSRHGRVFVSWGIGAAGALLGIFLWLDVIPALRGGFGWQWPYDPAPLARALPLIVLTGGYSIASWAMWRSRLRARWIIAWAMAGTLLLTAGVLLLRADDPIYELFARTVSPLTTGVHYAAAEIDWSGVAWHDWPALMRGMEGRIAHVSLAPPALPLLYAALADALDRLSPVSGAVQRALLPFQCHNYHFLAYTRGEWTAALLGMAMPLWAALGVIPLYALARPLGDRWARAVVLMFPLVPAVLAFTPSWNTLYPLMSACAFLALRRGLTGQSPVWYVCAGMLSGLWIFVNFAFVPLLLFFGLYMLLHQAVQPVRRWLRPVIAGGWFGCGAIAPWVVYYAVSGQTPWTLLSTSMNMHLSLERAYLPWMALHLWDWMMWAGLPLALLWIAGMIGWLRRRESEPPLIGSALALTLLTLILGNFARGETGRVWLLFLPFLLYAAADSAKRLSIPLVPPALGQAVAMIGIVGAIAAMRTDLAPPPAPPPAVDTANGADALFGDAFRLAGWDAETNDGEIVLRLRWIAVERMVVPYTFSALLVDPDGNAAPPATVWQPFAARFPTTCWLPGILMTDTVHLPLPQDAPAGEWWISLAAFDDDAGLRRLPVRAAGGAVDDQIGLGPVRVG